jgi:hypothetical protein
LAGVILLIANTKPVEISTRNFDRKKGKHPEHAMKAYRGSGGIVPLIIKLGTRWS